jgi:hypothetical protein
MAESRFDDVARLVASSTSRRQALRVLGGAAVGALFVRTGTAFAGGGNSACAHFCNSVFGEGTAAQSQCASDAAHHTGLCYTCGPASPSGTSPICCTQNSNGTCTSYGGATCCTTGQTCTNGHCAAVCTPSGSPCDLPNPGACCSQVCINGSPTPHCA